MSDEGTFGNYLSDDSRAVGRSLVIGLLGIAMIGFVVFLVFGGALLDGGDSETPTEQPDNGTDSMPDESDDSEDETQDDNSTEENLPETTDIDVNVWVKEIGDEARYSTLTLRNESGGTVERKSLTQIHSTSFENLSYGDDYTLTVEVDQWPEERITFNAGDFEERDVVVGYEFKAADSLRFVKYHNETEIATEIYQSKGTVMANGDSYNYLEYPTPKTDNRVWVEFMTDWSEKTSLASSRSDPEISELDGPGKGSASSVLTDPVFGGLDQYDDREYVTTTEIKNNPNRWVGNKTAGQTFDLYRVDLSSEYSEGHGIMWDEVLVYVSPRTGYVVRVESDHIIKEDPRQGSDWYKQPGVFVLEFFGHDQDYDVSTDDFNGEKPDW
jgi:hypothetical protein